MKYQNDKFVKQKFETLGENTEWFGYYNYDVISSDGRKMLCNRASFDGRSVTPEDVLELGWYDLTNGEWNSIGITDSFNWQQGAMLQWLPGEGNENKVIYNDSYEGHFRSVIYDIISKERKYINFPVYCVTPDGKFSISLNYERSYWCRAYHYQSVVNPDYNVRIALDDGVFRVNLDDGKVERIVDIAEVVGIDADSDFKNAKHWLEHIMINPSGTRIAFLHRFSYENAYSTRLFVCDIDGKNLQCINGWRSNDWSHFGWKGNDSFVIYSVKKNAFQASYSKSVQKSKSKFSLMAIINKIAHMPILSGLKNMLKPKEKYYKLYEYHNGAFEFAKNYDNKEFLIDGHPSFTSDGKYMITDTYPNEKDMQNLYIYNTQNGKILKLASFLAYYKGNPASCDLHPKLSYKGKYVVVDTAYSGIHRMIVFEINWDNVKESLE